MKIEKDTNLAAALKPTEIMKTMAFTPVLYVYKRL